MPWKRRRKSSFRYKRLGVILLVSVLGGVLAGLLASGFDALLSQGDRALDSFFSPRQSDLEGIAGKILK